MTGRAIAYLENPAVITIRNGGNMKTLDADAKVRPEAVKQPTLYVRGRFNPHYATQLADVARDAMRTDGKTLDLAKWPFTDPRRPILIRRVVKVQKDAKSGKEMQEETLYALDGNHRIRAAVELKLPTVPARIVECSDKEAALAQLSANVDQGLFLDRKARNVYIKTLLTDKDMRVTQKEVAAITHLSVASVNRILKDKQGTASESSKKARKAAKKARRGARVQTGFSTKQFFAELTSLAGDFDKNADAITKAAKARSTWKVSEEFKEFVSELKSAE